MIICLLKTVKCVCRDFTDIFCIMQKIQVTNQVQMSGMLSNLLI